MEPGRGHELEGLRTKEENRRGQDKTLWEKRLEVSVLTSGEQEKGKKWKCLGRRRRGREREGNWSRREEDGVSEISPGVRWNTTGEE